MAKSERDTDSWRGSGIIISATCLCLFIICIAIVFGGQKNYVLLNPISIIIIIVIGFIFFGIRYTKYTSYLKVEKRLKNLPKIQLYVLNFLTIIYLLIAIPGMLTAAILGRDFFL